MGQVQVQPIRFTASQETGLLGQCWARRTSKQSGLTSPSNPQSPFRLKYVAKTLQSRSDKVTFGR